MLMLMFLVSLAALVAAMYLFGTRGRSSSRGSGSHDFGAVSIRVDEPSACPAVLALGQKRFLCSEAPLLPLAECSAETCTCTFEHHADRRQGPRRVVENGGIEQPFDGLNQRAPSVGRRLDDHGEEPVPEPPADFDPGATYYDFIAQTGIDPQTTD